MSDINLDQKYKYNSPEDAVIKKDWAAGSADRMEFREFIIKKQNTKFVADYTTVKYPPALLKIIDEPIVNAVDHLVRCLGSKHPVTCIKVSVDQTGRIRIYNDGPGLEIKLLPEASKRLGREVHVPTFVFGELHQGSNNDKRPDDCIIGGVNGLGAKLSNCFSTDFMVETVDDTNFFIQRWRDHKKTEEPPKIVARTNPALPKDKNHQHTMLSFQPDYTGIFGYKEFNKQVFSDLCDLIRTRVFFASAYCHYTVGTAQKFDIFFNDEKVNVKSMAELAAILIPGAPLLTTKVTPQYANLKKPSPFRYQWEVCAVITPSGKYESNQFSNVNGIVVRSGKHTKQILNGLTESVKEKMAKMFNDKNLKFSPSHVDNNVVLFVNSKIPNPKWTGQRKDVLDLDIRKFAGYKLDTKFASDFADKVRDHIVESIFAKGPKATGQKKAPSGSYDKYQPADDAGGRYSLDCGLLVTEGDSAMNQVKTAVAATIGTKRIGIISSGGVFVNVQRSCTVVETSTGTHIQMNSMLEKNAFINALLDKCGLNPRYKYDPNSLTYKKEMDELNYGYIAACVDQDLDGKGFILGLLLNAFMTLFPNLLRSGYIRWFATPINRAYPKGGGQVHSFYSTEELKKWQETNNSDNYDIKYYKGLATHSKKETAKMFEAFYARLYRFYLDEKSPTMFKIYFGAESDDRKIELAKPTLVLTPEEWQQQETTRLISCSNHLAIETNAYQKDNLDRKLNHVIDGQNQAGRKILDGLMKVLHGNKVMNVSELAGFISQHENYHHGVDSLQSSICVRGFLNAGGVQLPFLVPQSFFGSRIEGGKDHGSARYIKATLNYRLTQALFPAEDYYILPFNFDEGKRGEPTYFVPLLPLAILESVHVPGTGWKIKTWARDVFKVIHNIKRLIRVDDRAELFRTPPTAYQGTTCEWKGSFRTVGGDPYSFGVYSVVGDKLIITELPLRMWTKEYLKIIRDKKEKDDRIIDHIVDKCDADKINIEITLKPGALELLDMMGYSIFTTGIEEYFQLRDHMDNHINLMGVAGEIIHHDTYEEVMYAWFAMRKEYYGKRIDRRIVIMQLKILRYENIIRYIEQKFQMNKLPRQQMIQAISDNGTFNKIYQARLEAPKFTPTEELRKVILESSQASYDYLLQLSDYKKSEEALAKYRQKITDLEEEIKALEELAAQGRFRGALMMEQELDALIPIIQEGQKTAWTYEREDKFKL